MTCPRFAGRVARPAPAAPAPHCVGDERPKLTVQQSLVALIAPLGAEHQLRIAACAPLTSARHPLLDATNVEAGFVQYLSPTYAHHGSFVALTPVSILQLRAEASFVSLWPTALAGTGYRALAQGEPLTEATLERPGSEHALGMNVSLATTLQAQVELIAGHSIALLNSVNVEYWSLRALGRSTRGGVAERFYLGRRDVVARAGGDWLVSNTATVLWMWAVTAQATLSMGATDDLVHVESERYTANTASAVALLQLRPVSALVRELQVFAKVGAFTAHAFREGWSTERLADSAAPCPLGSCAEARLPRTVPRRFSGTGATRLVR